MADERDDQLGTFDQAQLEKGSIENFMTYRPTLFIGLGGTGVNAVNCLKKRMSDFYGGKIDPIFQFFCIDSQEQDASVHRHLDANEYYHARVDFPGTFITNAYKKYLRGWWPEGHVPTRILAGCKGIRLYGRLALYQNAEVIHTSLMRAMRAAQMAAAARPPEERISSRVNKAYVFCSVCGGTGSGMFLDIPFMLRDSYPGDAMNMTAMIALHGLYSPEVLPAQKDQLIAGGTAALKELEQMMRLGLATTEDLGLPKSIEYPGAGGIHGAVVRPYDTVYLLEPTNQAGMLTINSPEKMGYTMADAAWLEIATPMGAALAGPFDNIGGVLVQSNRGKPTSFSSFGLSVLKYPNVEIPRYFAVKLSYELTRLILDQSPDFHAQKEAKEKMAALRLDAPAALAAVKGTLAVKDVTKDKGNLALEVPVLGDIREQTRTKKDEQSWKELPAEFGRDLQRLRDVTMGKLRLSLSQNSMALQHNVERLLQSYFDEVLDDPMFGVKDVIDFIDSMQLEINTQLGATSALISNGQTGKRKAVAEKEKAAQDALSEVNAVANAGILRRRFGLAQAVDEFGEELWNYGSAMLQLAELETTEDFFRGLSAWLGTTRQNFSANLLGPLASALAAFNGAIAKEGAALDTSFKQGGDKTRASCKTFLKLDEIDELYKKILEAKGEPPVKMLERLTQSVGDKPGPLSTACLIHVGSNPELLKDHIFMQAKAVFLPLAEKSIFEMLNYCGISRDKQVDLILRIFEACECQVEEDAKAQPDLAIAYQAALGCQDSELFESFKGKQRRERVLRANTLNKSAIECLRIAHGLPLFALRNAKKWSAQYRQFWSEHRQFGTQTEAALIHNFEGAHDWLDIDTGNDGGDEAVTQFALGMAFAKILPLSDEEKAFFSKQKPKGRNNYLYTSGANWFYMQPYYEFMDSGTFDPMNIPDPIKLGQGRDEAFATFKKEPGLVEQMMKWTDRGYNQATDLMIPKEFKDKMCAIRDQLASDSKSATGSLARQYKNEAKALSDWIKENLT